jgi:predicted ATPase
MSGTGKSTALAELRKRGFDAVDTHEIDAAQPRDVVVAELVRIGTELRDRV